MTLIRKLQTTIPLHNLSLHLKYVQQAMHAFAFYNMCKGVSFADSVFFAVQRIKNRETSATGECRRMRGGGGVVTDLTKQVSPLVNCYIKALISGAIRVISALIGYPGMSTGVVFRSSDNPPSRPVKQRERALKWNIFSMDQINYMSN